MSAELALPKYHLNAEQEKNEIVRHYRALSRSLRPKLKKGDKVMLLGFGVGYTWGGTIVEWA